MPLVVFNYVGEKEHPGQELPLHNYVQTLRLPRNAQDKTWKLVAVFATYLSNNKENFQTFEFTIPQLMRNENILYQNKGVDTTPPPEVLRYQRKHTDGSLNIDGLVVQQSVFGAVIEQPNLSFGRVKLEGEEISIVATARIGNFDKRPCSLRNFSVILEYNE